MYSSHTVKELVIRFIIWRQFGRKEIVLIICSLFKIDNNPL